MSRYVGMDLGLRSKHRAAVLDGVEARGRSFAVELTKEGMDRLLERAVEDTQGPVSFVMEPTGLAWLPVAAYVHAAGHRVFLTKPQKVSDLRKFYRKYTKTDVVDAVVAGRLPQLDPEGAHELIVPTAEQTTFRRLIKRRERLMREVADHKRRIHAALVAANPALMKAFGVRKFGDAKNAFLRRYVDPEKVVRLGSARLERFWGKRSKNKHDPKRIEQVMEACVQTAALYAELRRAGRLPFDYDAIQEDVNFELDRMEAAKQEVEKLERKIDQMYERLDPERTLEQLRGVGPIIAAALEALIVDIERFRNSKRFVGYTGLCPRKRQSGASDPRMPITKTGQRMLKKYLYLAADVARQWDPDFAEYYGRRYAAGDHHTKIMVALARKMACRVYALLKRRARARREADGERIAPQVRYVLRDRDHEELDPKQARDLIEAQYSREVVAPDRCARDKMRRTTGEAPRTAKQVVAQRTPHAGTARTSGRSP